MAFGITPKYKQDYNIENLDSDQFLFFAKEAALKLGWKIDFLSKTGLVARTEFSMSSWAEEVTLTIKDNVATLKSECLGNQLIDWGKNKANVHGLIAAMAELESTMQPEDLKNGTVSLIEEYVSEGEDILDSPPETTRQKVGHFFAIFKPTQGYFVTPILINVNILIFAIMAATGVGIFFPETQSLLSWGANFKPLTLEGQWRRLLTACFLHIGVLHLLLNMYALLYIGILLEPYLGKTRFLAAYLLSGIASSLVSLCWNDLTVSAGASGAIFGMYGVFLALLTTNLLEKSAKGPLLASIGVFIVYNLVNGLKPESGIDNAAHIGGLLSGLVIGYAYVPGLRQYENSAIKFSTVGILLVVLCISSFSVFKVLPNDMGTYDREIKKFVEMEAMALEVFNLPPDKPKEEILKEIKDRGIYYWNENLKLLESFEQMDLPLPVQEQNKKLKEYCELRLKSYDLLYEAVAEDSDKNNEQLTEYNRKIEALLAELNDKSK